MTELNIRINNWEKFNPRSDRANYTWFRMSNGFFQDHRIFHLSDDEKLLFLFLLCEASKSNSDVVRSSVEFVASGRGKSVDSISKSLQALISLAVITPAESRQKAGEEPSLLPATNVRTNERTYTHAAEIQNLVFEKQDALNQILGIFDDIFAKKTPPALKKQTTQAAALAHFGSVEALHEWLSAVVNEKPAEQTNPAWKTYVENRIRKEIRGKL